MIIDKPAIVETTVFVDAVFSTSTTSLEFAVLYITTLVTVPSSFTVKVIVSSLRIYPSGAIFSFKV